ALALNVSVRTLHRQLEDEGSSLQALKDEARREPAIEQLCRTTRPIKQVALAVGFAGENSLARAFRQWSGETPSDYPRKAGMQGSRRRIQHAQGRSFAAYALPARCVQHLWSQRDGSTHVGLPCACKHGHVRSGGAAVRVSRQGPDSRAAE